MSERKVTFYPHNKTVSAADGDNLIPAEGARREYRTALHILTPASSHWNPQVLTCSALKHTGLEKIWETVIRHRTALQASGELETKRRKQALDWMHFLLEEGLKSWFYHHPEIEAKLPELAGAVQQQTVSPTSAAGQLLGFLRKHDQDTDTPRT